MKGVFNVVTLTAEQPARTVAVPPAYNFCELTKVVLNWVGEDSPGAWYVEMAPREDARAYAICKVTPQQPEATISCLALPDSVLRMVPAGITKRKKQRGARITIMGESDCSGDLHSFYGVTCKGGQTWKIKSSVSFFECMTVVVRGLEHLCGNSSTRMYLQLEHEKEWVDIAHIPNERQWAVVDGRIIEGGMRLRVVVRGQGAGEAFKWDATTSIENLVHDLDAFDSADEAVEEPATEPAAPEPAPLPARRRSDSVEELPLRKLSVEPPGKHSVEPQRKRSAEASRKHPAEPPRKPSAEPLRKRSVAAKSIVIKPSTKKTRTPAETDYLNDVIALLRKKGPCRISMLGSKLKKPASVPRLAEFFASCKQLRLTADLVALKD